MHSVLAPRPHRSARERAVRFGFRVPIAALVWTGALVAVAPQARAQYTTVILTAPAYSNSDARRISGSYTVGDSYNTPTVGPDVDQATLWTGPTASSYVDLGPSSFGYTTSDAEDTNGAYTVGYGAGPATGSANIPHALLWTGPTASSYVDLNPAGYEASDTFGIGGAYIVGAGDLTAADQNNGYDQALVWTGTTASSYVNIAPVGAGYSFSAAYATNGTYIVGGGSGTATGGNNDYHALLWTGLTASSFVDLNPTGFTSSDAFDISGSYTVGHGYGAVTGGDYNYNALLWTGTTASSFVNLNPAGYATSDAYGTNGTSIVGYGSLPDESSADALLWTGPTASSAIDLQTKYLAAAGFTNSVATGINAQGDIVGDGETSSGDDASWELIPSAAPPAAAPEPGSLLFLLGGALPVGGGIIARRRRRL